MIYFAKLGRMNEREVNFEELKVFPHTQRVSEATAKVRERVLAEFTKPEKKEDKDCFFKILARIFLILKIK